MGCQSVSSLGLKSFPSNADGFRNRLYTGAALGQSRLNPDTAGTEFRVETTSSAGTQLKLGYDLHNAVSLELDTALLGSSALGQANIGVEYSAVTLNALIYGFGGLHMQSRRGGFSSFVRLGYGQVNNVSIIDDFDFKRSTSVLGLGVEYGFANGFGIRTEIIRFDSDVSYVGIGGIFRFGQSPENSQSDHVTASVEPVRVIEPVDVPVIAQAQALAVVHTPEILLDNPILPLTNTDASATAISHTYTASEGDLADRWRPEKRKNDRDSDGVLDSVDQCPSTGSFVTVGSDGCGLFDQTLNDVIFTKGSVLLNAAARRQLSEVADILLAFPESRIQINAHTDASGPAHKNLALSLRRATAIAHYLRSLDVDQKQLYVNGFGESQPLVGNNTVAERMKNRRIELITLPDLDADQLTFQKAARQLPVNSVSQVNLSNVGHPREKDSKAAEQQVSRSKLASDSLLVKKTNKLPAASKEPVLLSAEVTPIPVPGYAPGVDIAGIIEGVEFGEKSALLTDAGKDALLPVLQRLLDNPKIAIAIMAHSDDVGEELDNENLTIEQAQAVVAFFVASGISRERMQAEGYGERLPLVQNLTKEDRARNRRIEIRVLPKWPESPD